MFASLLFGTTKTEHMKDNTTSLLHEPIKTPLIKDKALSFIKLTNNGLNFICENQNILDDIKVISIIGNGRSGKSTFLNCISSFLNKNDTLIFDVQNTDEHCTSGIDMYYYKEHNIILLDCQGLQLSDSSHDPQLLLITYLISDCIIYNQKSMLNNDIFNTLSPLATFINYFENIQSNKNKPILYFRINDVELSFDAQNHLEKTLMKKNDQYQNVRDAIQNLFSRVHIGITNSIDRSEKNLLAQHRYYEFINNTDNNFNKTISELINIPINKKNYNNWFQSINEFIKKINSNEKIDFTKLDVYQLLIEKEILEFKLSISSDNYNDFSVNSFQSSYDSDILPKIEYRNNCLQQFKHKFQLLNNSFFDKNYNEIEEKLDKPIDKALIQIELLANSAIQSIENQVFNMLNIYSCQSISYEDLFHKYIKHKKQINIEESKKMLYIDKINEFLERITPYYKKVVSEYNGKYNVFIDKTSKLISDFVSNNIVTLELWNDKIRDIIKNMDKINNSILKLFEPRIFLNNKLNNLNNLQKIFINEFILDKYGNIHNYDIDYKKFYADNKHIFNILSINIFYTHLDIVFIDKNDLNNNNDINLPIYSYLKNTIKTELFNKFMENKEFTKICITKAKQGNLLIFNNHITVKDGNVVDPINGEQKLYHKLKDGNYDLKKLKRGFVLKEFKKWLYIKFNKNFILDNNKIFNVLMYGGGDNTTKHLLKLYADFRTEYELLHGNISFIKIKE